jgi:CRISPR-associated protein Cmr1
MYKVSFLVENITPLFLSGADNKTIEPRPSAFKGMMRFWWRAVRAETETKKLWKEEARIFGAADEKFGRSRVRINLKWDKKKFEKQVKQDTKKWLKKDLKDYFGVKYLLYSVGLNIREFLLPGFEFEITLSCSDKETLKKAIASFWCLIFLGGIGTRARRGGGNLKVKYIKEGEEYLNGIEFTIDDKDIERWFKENLDKVKQLIGCKSERGNYTSISKGTVLIFDPLNSWEKALDKIGKSFRNFRNRKEPDYSSVREYLLSGKAPNYIEKVEFGLPLSYRYKSLDYKSAIIEGANKERQRSASPLIFKVIEVNKEFYPLIILLNKPYLLPDEDKLKIRDTTKKGVKQKAKIFPHVSDSQKIINDFLSTLPKCRRIYL